MCITRTVQTFSAAHFTHARYLSCYVKFLRRKTESNQTRASACVMHTSLADDAGKDSLYSAIGYRLCHIACAVNIKKHQRGTKVRTPGFGVYHWANENSFISIPFPSLPRFFRGSSVPHGTVADAAQAPSLRPIVRLQFLGLSNKHRPSS